MNNGFGRLAIDPTIERWLTPSILVIANLVPIVGVLAWQWDAGVLVMLYWAENLVIGLITILKMLRASPIGGLFSTLFFLVHYGGFCAVHGMLAGSFFGWPTDDVLKDATWPFLLIFVEMLYKVVHVVFTSAPTAWFWGLAAVGLSHFFSYLFHHWYRGEDSGKSTSKLMGEPYGRIVVLHIAVLLGGALTQALGSPFLLLLILIALKIGVDLVVHRRRHRLDAPEGSSD